MKIIDLFEFPPESLSLPQNQRTIKDIEIMAKSRLDAVEMLMDSGITTPEDYYNLDDWFWTQPKTRIKQILLTRKATII